MDAPTPANTDAYRRVYYAIYGNLLDASYHAQLEEEISAQEVIIDKLYNDIDELESGIISVQCPNCGTLSDNRLE